MNDMAPAATRRLDPAMGNLGYERNPADFYPTEAWCTEALLRNYDFPKDKLVDEPACGQGHISKVLLSHGFAVRSRDLNETGYGESGFDFLAVKDPMHTVITNPPYKNNFAQRFVCQALKLTEAQQGIVAMFMRTDWSSAAGRAGLMCHPAFALKLELTKRPRWIEGSTGSPRHNYSFFLWDWRTIGQPPTIRWDQ